MYFHKLKLFVKKIDLFGQPIQLSFNNTPLQKTLFGGLNTLILLLVFSLVSLQSFTEIITKSHLNTSTTDNYETNPPFMDLSPKVMSWLFKFNQDQMNVWGNGSYFTIQVQQVTQSRDIKGDTIKNRTNMRLKPCALEDFNSKVRNDILGLTRNVSSLMCPISEDFYKIEGKFSSEDFSYLSFKISACVNSSNLTCARQEDIDGIFKAQKNQINFQLYFVNNMINVNNYENPVTTFLDDRIYTTINRKLYKGYNFYFTKNKIFNDDSFLQTNWQESLETFTYDNDYDETEVDIGSDMVYCSMYIRSNFISKYHTRSYDKIWKFVSFVGGVWSIFFMVFSIVGRNYNKLKLFLKIANEIYDFSDDIVESQKNLQIFNKPSIKQQNFLFKSENLNNIGNHENDFSKMIIHFLNQKTLVKLKLNLKYFFICFLRKPIEKAFLSVQKILKEEAFFEINKRLDVVNLLRKLNEIEKLKTLLLDHNQKILFDIPNKTKITVEKMNDSTLKFKKRLTRREITKERRKSQLINETMLEMKKNYEAYLAIQDESQCKDLTLGNFGEKILQMVDKQQLKIFKEMKKKEVKVGFLKTTLSSLEKAKTKDR